MRIIVLLIAFVSIGMAQTAASKTSGQLHDLFKEDWEWSLREYPESATYAGDGRYNDRLTDLSFPAIERRKLHEREMLSRIEQIDRAQLKDQDVISYDLYLLNKQLAVESQRFPMELMPLTQMNGPQIDFGQLASSTSFESVKDYENYIRRLEGFPEYLRQVTALMRKGIETGWLPSAVPLRSVPLQIEGQIVEVSSKSPLYAPFEMFPSAIRDGERSRLRTHAEAAIRDGVVPSLRTFLTFIKDVYLPACRQDISASSLKDGDAFYRYSIREETTTALSPQEIHSVGLREVARVRKEMEDLIGKIEFKGTFHEFLTFLRTDPQFYYTNPREMIAGFAAIAKRMDAELPRLFAELPRTPYGIREMPEYEAPAQTTAYYMPSAADGSRAGYFYVNTYKLETRPKYEMEALTLHESVPGHHLQIARAQERGELPEFRQNGSYTAYIEGWGLYAESLGDDIGFYSDPYSKFGQLTYEMWRACRLVVDTGIHSLGWTRQQAIDFMLENTAKTENDVTVEVDRYIVWPAQALSYKLGELKIKELRGKTQTELGENFDLRKFHNAILDNGPLPLDILGRQIDSWIAEQKAKREE
jgi:uncharacterized protein (DUF885 family)